MTDLTKYQEIQTELDVGGLNPYNVQGTFPDWVGTDFQGIADALNLKNISEPKPTISGSEVFSQIDEAEFDTITATEKQFVLSLAAIDTLDPYGIGAQIIQRIFGGGVGPNTIAALLAYRDQLVSIADQNGWGFVTAGDILRALAYGLN